MVVVLVLLWGLLHGRGVGGLSGPHSLTLRSREAALVRCVYDDGFDHYIKYWCKGESAKHCEVLIRTETTRKVSSGRFTIQDHPSSRSFDVTMTNARAGDSDTYYCGIERNLVDNMHRVEVEVLPGVCVMKAPWTYIVEFPTNFRQIEVTQEVKVTCKEKYEKKNITLRCRERSEGFVLSGLGDGDSCVGVCRKASPWTDIVNFPESFTEVAVDGLVVVSCQKRFLEKTLRLRCREEDGKFLFSPEDGDGSCVGVCRGTSPWTDILDFPTNFSGIEVGRMMNVTCKEKYEKKTISLRCRERSGGFVLSAMSDNDSCVGVCRKASPWTDIVDFPENFTEIAVSGLVVVSCQQRFLEKTLRLRCWEEDGKFLFSPEDGDGSCVGKNITALTNLLRSLLTSTFGFVVPFMVKLVVLLVMLGVKISCVINSRLNIHRKESNLKRSPLETGDDIQEPELNDYIPPPTRAPIPQKGAEIPLQPMEEEQEIYENLQEERCE